jgi:hypothetical protein
MTRATWILASAAFLLSFCGGLLVLEILRPFRDLAIDGPIALGAWTLGIALSIVSYFVGGRSRVLSSLALAINLLPLLGVVALLLVMRASNFAWH